MEIKSKVKVFDGVLYRIGHTSVETKTQMTFALYIPFYSSDSEYFADSSLKIPSIVYLSGLTCTDENVCQKSGIFSYLSNAKVSSLLYVTVVCRLTAWVISR
jgi:S-formylglutathione hydrolase FrmB